MQMARCKLGLLLPFAPSLPPLVALARMPFPLGAVSMGVCICTTALHGSGQSQLCYVRLSCVIHSCAHTHTRAKPTSTPSLPPCSPHRAWMQQSSACSIGTTVSPVPAQLELRVRCNYKAQGAWGRSHPHLAVPIPAAWESPHRGLLRCSTSVCGRVCVLEAWLSSSERNSHLLHQLFSAHGPVTERRTHMPATRFK